MSKSEEPFEYRFLQARDSESRRTLLLLHGTGGNEDSLLPLADQIDPFAAVLSPRGRVLENGMPRWFRRFAEGVFDLEDLRFRGGELASFLPVAAAKHGVDPGGLFGVGYSNGANMAAAMLLLGPQFLAGAILIRPMVPIRPESNPELARMPILILAGTEDRMCPPKEAEELAAMLAAAGARVDVRFLTAGHELTSEDIDLARAWLADISL